MAKFHYAIQLASWFEAGLKLVADGFKAGSKLVADRFEAGRRSAASWNLAYHLAC